MSDFKVVIPDIGDAQDVEVVEICVEVGQRIEIDDALLVIESDKASMEVPAPVAGEVKTIEMKLGDIIDTGDLVAVIDAVERDETEPAKTVTEEPSVEPQPTIEEPAQPKAIAETDGVAVAEATSSELFEVSLPELGDVDDVEVVEVLVKVGQEVAENQALVVLESDKATMEIPAELEGVIESIAVAVGDKVEEHSLIATIRTKGKATTELTPTTTVAQQSRTVPDGEAQISQTSSIESISEVKPAERRPRDRGAAVYAGPAVRRLARELGVDLGLVEGSGVRGRIIKDDVKQFVKTLLLSPPQTESAASGIPAVEYPDFTRFGETEEVELTRMQARGAQNLVRSWLNAVHVTQHDEADVTELEEFRAELNAQGQIEERLTALPFIVKACAATLREHPRFNASIAPSLQSLILKKYIHIGIAVDTDEGLIVPVLRDVLDKGLRDIAIELANLSTAARTKSLKPDQISGASFTVSSLGRIGGTGFTPIINAPEVAILGVARLATKPVWMDSAFEPRKILPLSLSYDHRAINGAEGGRFMQSLVEKLGDVRRLIL